ncbi:uncharacterized protein ATNIH1004_011662 [Aspergillus tanneri]|uniref:Uncharacterized protein n=1 Tax=Aspergillus tanneri TaxID=1220188 RepID=A0A5M9M7F9_9EURO|nr:uncharacterized protein ATNIH1004_011662 [Aspergillus tanneri]KAA8641526.1 hypothetical protein ATNIH1004_011662 [Aspergillus tanneri]
MENSQCLSQSTRWHLTSPFHLGFMARFLLSPALTADGWRLGNITTLDMSDWLHQYAQPEVVPVSAPVNTLYGATDLECPLCRNKRQHREMRENLGSLTVNEGLCLFRRGQECATNPAFYSLSALAQHLETHSSMEADLVLRKIVDYLELFVLQKKLCGLLFLRKPVTSVVGL